MNQLFSKLMIPIKKVTRADGTFSWPKKPLLVSDSLSDDLPLEQLCLKLKKHLKITSFITFNAFGPATLRIRRDPGFKQVEAYRISITPEGIQITTGSDAGTYYAIQTLCDLVTVSAAVLPCCRIDDARYEDEIIRKVGIGKGLPFVGVPWV